MAAYNTIQVKYSIANSAIPDLLPGEFAFTQAGNNLFIGAPDGQSGAIRVGGKYHDGILTANHALVANSTGGINQIITTNVTSNGVQSYYVYSHISATDIQYANAAFINYLHVDAIEANSINLSTNVNTTSIQSETISSNNLTSDNIQATYLYSNTIVANNLDANSINVGIILANGTIGSAGNILYSSGVDGNSYWGILALDSTVVNTSGDFTLSGNVTISNVANFTGNVIISNQASLTGNLNVTGTLIDSTGNTGNVGSYLTSTGTSVQWKTVEPPYYYTTEMYDYTEYGIGWMNVAPNQNAETLGFRTDVFVPFGAIWILAINDGLVDEPPITIYSPSTRTTPMLWMSIDGSGPYDPDTNPNGQAYWFNITPPPSGG